MEAETPDLPGSLRPTSTSPFVGRIAELEKLRSLIRRPRGRVGGWRCSPVSPAPARAAWRVSSPAGPQATGRSSSTAAATGSRQTPTGPSSRHSIAWVRVTDVDRLRAAIGPGGGELTRLLPDLPALVGELPESVGADPDTERHRLHTAVADLLARVSLERPMLLVLEDGHWADVPTLLLLRHLARSAWNARLLLLVTYRDTEAEVPGELTETLADLWRSGDVVRMGLSGLSEAEIADLVGQAAEGDSGPELAQLAATIRDLTGGNAFLVCELWRALLESRHGRGRRRSPHRHRAAVRAGDAGGGPGAGQPAALATGSEDGGPARPRRHGRLRVQFEAIGRATGLTEAELLEPSRRRSRAG